jgi:choline transport protein
LSYVVGKSESTANSGLQTFEALESDTHPGWLSALGWQAAIATTAYSTGTLILELASLNNPGYTYTNWQGTLMTMMVLLLVTLFNTVFAKRLPLFEGVILFLHIFGFFAILLPLAILSPKAPATEVFGSAGFANYGGWSSIGGACVVGMLTATGSLGGSDSAVSCQYTLWTAPLTDDPCDTGTHG